VNRRTELSGSHSLERPRDPENVDAVRYLVEGEGFLSRKHIGDMPGLHHGTVKRKVNCKWIPHTLKSSQKAVRVQVSKDLFQFLDGVSDRKLCNVYTGDETWIIHGCLCGSGRTLQDQPCLGARLEPRMHIPERVFQGNIGAVVMLSPEQSFNRDFFADNAFPKLLTTRHSVVQN
jgi:hypothetical protein